MLVSLCLFVCLSIFLSVAYLPTCCCCCVGYPYRRSFADFNSFFWQLRPAGRYCQDEATARHAAALLLEQCHLSSGADYQVGLTKVFLRAGQAAYLVKLRTQALARAATAIQSAWRCYVMRQQYVRTLEAAVVLQCGVRGMLARAHARFIRQTNAATVIQAHWRAAVARDSYQKQRMAIIALQAAWRGYAARGVLAELRYQHQCTAASTISAHWRGYKVRRGFQAQQKAAVVLQASWRGVMAKRVAAELALQHAAVVLQSAWRKQSAVWAYNQQLAAAVLQAAWRGRAARAAYLPLLKQHRAAVCIQRAWKQHHERSSYYSQPKYQAAAAVIQSVWRIMKQRRLRVQRFRAVVTEYVQLHNSCVFVQCAWRVRLAQREIHQLEQERRRARFREQMKMFETVCQDALVDLDAKGGNARNSRKSDNGLQGGGAINATPTFGIQFPGVQSVAGQAQGAPVVTNGFGGKMRGLIRGVSGKSFGVNLGTSSSHQAADVVKADETPLLDKDARLQQRLGEAANTETVSSMLSFWKQKLSPQHSLRGHRQGQGPSDKKERQSARF